MDYAAAVAATVAAVSTVATAVSAVVAAVSVVVAAAVETVATAKAVGAAASGPTVADVFALIYQNLRGKSSAFIYLKGSLCRCKHRYHRHLCRISHHLFYI
jgi:hypothetical protein